MKKVIAPVIALTVMIAVYAFGTVNTEVKSESNTEASAPAKKVEFNVTNSDVWDYMRDNVFTKLDALVEYDKKKMFSRCPSGFGQQMAEEISDNSTIYGRIYFMQGCSDEDFCWYKLNWEKKETYLKKTEEEETYVSVNTFVREQKKIEAKI